MGAESRSVGSGRCPPHRFRDQLAHDEHRRIRAPDTRWSFGDCHARSSGCRRSRITFKDEGDAAIDGVWGIVGPSGYGQITRVISRDDAGVVRGLALLSGSFSIGEVVELDASAYPEDPRSAHGLPFEEIRVPSDLGVNPAWLITGENDTWIVFVHGAAGNGRTEALRVIPTFRKLGFPVLVITYRDDASGGAGDDLRYTWGLDEWRDVDAALATATLRGADDFILVGHDMGASIISTFLHESELAPNVRGVIFDSAVLDLEEVIDEIARDRGIPGYLATIGKSIARIRFGLEWSRLDQLERVLEFDPSLPMLVLHGTDDAVAPITTTDAFCGRAAAGDLRAFPWSSPWCSLEQRAGPLRGISHGLSHSCNARPHQRAMIGGVPRA